ncbi:sensor histidine kinase [Amycolatopsis pithecellobii]|uniref:HAMP domain-containing protein n=1 Tax=Amycolatopsis pithecellobii TaxID=664692 RepID=A0A6N7Z1R7_9PSEU|nr:CHASE3 domain-containing protein [Amycolatopsis pithecellobii]MTD55393.1 HAMP domain-containing protein [Amycolatopsis pithecellobii]
MYAIVGGLLVLLAVTAVATTVSRLYATSVGNHVRDSLRPAQQSAAALSKDYVDMETGVRGFILTHDDRFLGPYESGRSDVVSRDRGLRELLSFDGPSLRLLGGVDAAAQAWEQQSIMPGIAGVRDGTLDVAANAETGREAFDVVRARVADLQSRIDELTATGLGESTAATNTANTITITCAVLALILGAIIVLLLRNSLDAPLRRLVGQVRQVSDGELDRGVDAGGPAEIAELGRAVEVMRVRILSEIDRATEVSQQLVRLEETDRIARELGDTVLKRLFAIGLDLQSAAGRFPAARGVFTSAVGDLDQAINQLRSSLYGHTSDLGGQALGLSVQTLVSDLETELGVVPELVLTGDLDGRLPDEVVAEVLGVLTDAMGVLLTPGVRELVEIGLARDDGMIRLRVTGPEPESVEPLEALGERARLHHGDARTRATDGRVVLEWWVPV